MNVAEVFGWSPETWTAVGTLALAGTTVLALLASPLHRWTERARLRMEMRTSPPWSHVGGATIRVPRKLFSHKTLRRTWRIEFGPEWSDDESTMLGLVRIEEA